MTEKPRVEHETKGEKVKRGTTSIGKRTKKGNGDGRVGKILADRIEVEKIGKSKER